MDCRERLQQWLREQRVAFDLTPHAEAFTAQRVAASEHVTGYLVAKVVMARTLAEDPMIVFNAGSHRETMTLAYADFARLVQPQVGEFASAPRAAAV